MVKYQINTHKRVEKFLSYHPDIAKRFVEKLRIMTLDPFDKFLDIKLLENTDGDYRLRIGKYRFFFTIIQDQIIVYFFDADSRGDSYKSRLSK